MGLEEYGIQDMSRIAKLEEEQFGPKFYIGDLVRKKSGAAWEGYVVGWYSTSLTQRGYCVESRYHQGSVQIYPNRALELVERQARPRDMDDF